MKYMRYLMALSIMLAMMGWAYADEAVVNMAGGTASIIEQSGGATGGYAYSFYSNDDFIQADILALAYTDGIGKAKVKTEVPTYVSRTYEDEDDDEVLPVLTVGAKGTVTASVEGKSTAAEVTSAGQIHAFAGAEEGPGAFQDEDGNTLFDGEVFGNAWISSTIGHEWTVDDNGAPDLDDDAFQTGNIEGKPTGMFYADATADGEARYSAVYDPEDYLDQVNYLEISGSVAGKTTLEGEVADNGAEIKGFTGSIDTYPITHWFPNGQAADNINAWLQNAVQFLPLADDDGMRDDSALVAAMASGAAADNNGPFGPYSAAGVANIIAVAAENDGIPADALTYAAGTGEGASTARAKVKNVEQIGENGNALFTEEEFKVSASKEDKMSADVRVIKALDAATAHSLLATGAVSTDLFQGAGSIANTFAGVRRENPGNAADGSDRTWGESFISSGKWDSWAVELEDGAVDDKASVSGQLVQEPPQLGMGAGAFLQNKKLEPAYANMLFVQVAAAGIVDKIDAQLAVVDIMGPKAHSLGSSSWDGSGVSADLTNLHVQAFEEDTNDQWDPTEISTDIANLDAYLWCDGTNDNQYNGPGFSASNPVFDPAGVGQFTGQVIAYLPSPTQRETLIALATTDRKSVV